MSNQIDTYMLEVKMIFSPKKKNRNKPHTNQELLNSFYKHKKLKY